MPNTTFEMARYVSRGVGELELLEELESLRGRRIWTVVDVREVWDVGVGRYTDID